MESLFQGYDFGTESAFEEGALGDGVAFQIPEHLEKEFNVVKLIDGYRTRGHLFTKTNPVRDRRRYTPTLKLSNFNLSESDLDDVFDAGSILGIGSKTLRDYKNI